METELFRGQRVLFEVVPSLPKRNGNEKPSVKMRLVYLVPSLPKRNGNVIMINMVVFRYLVPSLPKRNGNRYTVGDYVVIGYGSQPT